MKQELVSCLCCMDPTYAGLLAQIEVKKYLYPHLKMIHCCNSMHMLHDIIYLFICPAGLPKLEKRGFFLFLNGTV